nr:hypothetical protein [Bacteroides intestinalis]
MFTNNMNDLCYFSNLSYEAEILPLPCTGYGLVMLSLRLGISSSALMIGIIRIDGRHHPH